MKHAVINSKSHKVINIIEWDGVSKWSPPKDHYILKSELANVGQVYELRTKSFVDDPQNIKNELT